MSPEELQRLGYLLTRAHERLILGMGEFIVPGEDEGRVFWELYLDKQDRCGNCGKVIRKGEGWCEECWKRIEQYVDGEYGAG